MLSDPSLRCAKKHFSLSVGPGCVCPLQRRSRDVNFPCHSFVSQPGEPSLPPCKGRGAKLPISILWSGGLSLSLSAPQICAAKKRSRSARNTDSTRSGRGVRRGWTSGGGPPCGCRTSRFTSLLPFLPPFPEQSRLQSTAYLSRISKEIDLVWI